MNLDEVITLLEAHLKEIEAATSIGVIEEYTARVMRYPEDQAIVDQWQYAIDTLRAIRAAVAGEP